LLACAGFQWFEMAAFPGFDAVVSARPLWLAGQLQCAPQSNRSTLYGLYYYSYYYSGKRIPNCAVPD
jgi:hypothetical protein